MVNVIIPGSDVHCLVFTVGHTQAQDLPFKMGQVDRRTNAQKEGWLQMSMHAVTGTDMTKTSKPLFCFFLQVKQSNAIAKLYNHSSVMGGEGYFNM